MATTIPNTLKRHYYLDAYGVQLVSRLFLDETANRFSNTITDTMENTNSKILNASETVDLLDDINDKIGLLLDRVQDVRNQTDLFDTIKKVYIENSLDEIDHPDCQTFYIKQNANSNVIYMWAFIPTSVNYVIDGNGDLVGPNENEITCVIDEAGNLTITTTNEDLSFMLNSDGELIMIWEPTTSSGTNIEDISTGSYQWIQIAV